MNRKKAIMREANDIIQYLRDCIDSDFICDVLEHINDGIEFGDDEIKEVGR